MKLRQLRLAKRLRLKDLADGIGCSESMLSKIENDKATPSLVMLHKIASALGTNVSQLFDQLPQDGFITRHTERPIIQATGAAGAGVSFELLTPTVGPSLYQSSIHSIQAGGHSDGAIAHDGEDFGYILEGEFELFIGDNCYVLKAGDAFAFPSTIPHSYRNMSDRTARVIWFNTPPTF